MRILTDIKIGRLVLAITVTLLIADTVPHPNLSAGLVENSFDWVQTSLAEAKEQVEAEIAESNR